MTDKNIIHVATDDTLDEGKSGIKVTGNRALIHRPHGTTTIVESAVKGDVTRQDTFDAGNIVKTDITDFTVSGDSYYQSANHYLKVAVESGATFDLLFKTDDGKVQFDVKTLSLSSSSNASLLAGGSLSLKDFYLSSAITLSESGQTALATTSQSIVGAINEIKNIDNTTLESTGFINPETCGISYSDTAKQLTLTTVTGALWRSKVQPDLVDGWVSPVLTPSAGLNFLYYNGTSVIWSSTPWEFSDLLIGIALYASDGTTFIEATKETHGLEQHQAHKEFHERFGTYRGTGGAVSSIVLDSTTATDRRPQISACLINDEDCPSTLDAHITENNYTLMSNTFVGVDNIFTTGSAEIVPLNGTNPQWNEYTDGDGPDWSLTDVPNNNHMSMWLMVCPTAVDNDMRYKWVVGQEVSSTLAAQQGLSPSSLDLTAYGLLSPEFVFIQQVVIKYSGGNWEIADSIVLTGSKATYNNISGKSGESNTNSNAGTGVGIALAKVGTDLPLASLTSAGGTVGISLDGDNLNLETIGTSSNATSIQSVPVDTAPVGALANNHQLLTKFYENALIQNIVYSDSAWTKELITLDESTGKVSSTGSAMTGLIASIDDTVHNVRQSVTMTAEPWTFIIEAEKGDKNHLVFLATSTGTPQGSFNLDTCAIGTQNAGVIDSEIEDLGGGKCRIHFEILANVALVSVRVYSAESDNNVTFAGDGSTVSTFIGNFEVKRGTIAQVKKLPYTQTTTTAISMQQIDWVDKDISTEDATALIDGGETALHSHIVAVDELDATGTPSASTFLRGDGSWETADSGGSNATSIQSVPVDTAPVGALAHLKTFIAKWYQNYLRWSEDLSQGIYIRTALAGIDGTDGIIPNTTATNHYLTQLHLSDATTSGHVQVKFQVEVGNSDLFYLQTRLDDGIGGTVYIDFKYDTNLMTVLDFDGDNYTVTEVSTGIYDVEFDATGYYLTSTQNIRIFLMNNAGATNFAGDGVTVMTRYRNLQTADGTISQNLPYQETTTTAISRQQIDWVESSPSLHTESLHGEMLGLASSVVGLFAKVASSQLNPSGIGITSPTDILLNGLISPYEISRDVKVMAIRVVCGKCAVAGLTVGTAPTFRLDFYKHDLTTRTLVTNGTVRVPLISGLTSVLPSNDLTGGTETVIFEIVLPDSDIILNQNDLIGYEFVNESTDENTINSAGVIFVDVFAQEG